MKNNRKFLALSLTLWASQNLVMGNAALAESGIETLEDFDYWQNLCELQTQSENAEEALLACEQAIALRPNDETIWAKYSYTHLTFEQYPETLAAVDRVLNINDQNSQAMTYQCLAYLGLNQTEAALDACNAAIETNSYWGNRTPALAWRTRGQILHQMDQTDQALIAYDRALTLEPNDSPTLAYRCQTLVDTGEYQHGLSACDAALNGNGQWSADTHAIAFAYQGKAANQLGDFATAIAAYDSAISLQPEEPEYWIQQAKLLEDTQSFAAAALSYARAVELAPDASRALVGQCSVLNQQAQYELAKAACEQAIAGNGEWWAIGPAQAWRGLAQALTGLGDYESAIAAADRAVGIQPEYLAAQSDRMVILWYLNDYDNAIKVANGITSTTPVTEENVSIIAKTWGNLGRIYSAQGNTSAAGNAYNRSITLDSSNSEVYANLSAHYWRTQNYSEAQNAAYQAIHLNSRSEQAWQNLGAAQVALEQYPEAQQSYNKVLEINEQNASAWAGLGNVQHLLADIDNAKTSLQTAIQLNPDQALALRLLKEIEALEEAL
ncbi:MAG: tetratricopeptide repeat protein [Cyanobacteria bacterium J06560_6]